MLPSLSSIQFVTPVTKSWERTKGSKEKEWFWLLFSSLAHERNQRETCLHKEVT